jgi:hypothetical protein
LELDLDFGEDTEGRVFRLEEVIQLGEELDVLIEGVGGAEV